MEEKLQVMVALGTALGANCIPCFDHLYARARETGVDAEQIREIMNIADRVKAGAAAHLKTAVGDVVGEVAETAAPCCTPSAGCRC